MFLGVIVSLGVLAHAQTQQPFDEFERKRQELVAINSTTNELQEEIANLERVSADRQRKIQDLNARIRQAQARLEGLQGKAEESRIRARQYEQQLASVQNDSAMIEDQERAELAKIEAERQLELTKKAELMVLLAKLQTKKKATVQKRQAARYEVEEIQRENQRLYDRVGKRNTVTVVGEQAAP